MCCKEGLTPRRLKSGCWQFTAKGVLSRTTVYWQAAAGISPAFLDDLMARLPVPFRALWVAGGLEFMAVFEKACQFLGIAFYVLSLRSPQA